MLRMPHLFLSFHFADTAHRETDMNQNPIPGLGAVLGKESYIDLSTHADNVNQGEVVPFRKDFNQLSWNGQAHGVFLSATWC